LLAALKENIKIKQEKPTASKDNEVIFVDFGTDNGDRDNKSVKRVV